MKTIHKYKIILFLNIFVCFSAAAQETGHNRLQEIVISGNRWCQEIDVIPTKITRLNLEQTNAYNPQTAADMLGLSGEVFIQKSQYGGGSPMIRGFSTNRLLYSVDGVRMNSAIFRSGNLQNVISLDPFAIRETEILFGPGAVSYGSDAIGGVMLFNTLQPRLSNSDVPHYFGSATVRTATASNELTTHVHAGVGFRHWGFLTSFTHSSFEDLKQGAHGPKEYLMPYIVQPGYGSDGTVVDNVIANTDERKQSPSGYSQYNFMQKVRYKPNNHWNFEYAFHFSETSEYARYDRHQRMRKGLPRYAEWNYGPQKWIMNQFLLEHSGRNFLYDSLRLNTALQRFEESRISRSLNDPLRETQSEEVDAWSANLDMRKSIARNVTLCYGLEYVQNNVRSLGEGLDITTRETSLVAARYPKAEWYSVGAYLQGGWHITHRLNIEGGIRYNHYKIDNDFSTAGYEIPFESEQTANEGSISGNIGLNWRPSSGWLLRLNYACGFRAPNVDDMGKLFDSVDGCVTVPNPSLKPEYADNIEMGVVKHFLGFLKLDVTAYYTHLDNAIVRRDFLFNGKEKMVYQGEECRVQALQNAAVANVWGIQFGADARFTRYFYANANLNYQHGREELDNGDKSPSRHAAPMFGRVALGFDNSKLRIEAYTAFQAECKADDMPEEEKEKTEIYALDSNGMAYSPSWITINLRASYAMNSQLMFNATLENITDKRYRPYSCGISAPGRNMTLSATYSF